MPKTHAKNSNDKTNDRPFTLFNVTGTFAIKI